MKSTQAGAFSEPSLAQIKNPDYLLPILRKKTELQQAKAELVSMILGQPYVVVTACNIPLTFQSEGQQVRNPSHVAGPHKATRFTRADAEHVASCVIDGTGEPARAVHIITALDDAIRSIDSLVALLTAQAND